MKIVFRCDVVVAIYVLMLGHAVAQPMSIYPLFNESPLLWMLVFVLLC
jgi:hypothetical protein